MTLVAGALLVRGTRCNSDPRELENSSMGLPYTEVQHTGAGVDDTR